MKTNLHIIKTLFIPAAFLLFGAMSCMREEIINIDSNTVAASDEVSVTLGVQTPDAQTKSILPGTYFTDEKINNVLYLAIGSDGSWKTVYTTNAGSGNNFPGTLRLRAGTYDYTVYALVNMGDVSASIPRNSAGVPIPENYRHDLGTFSSLSSKGMPMAAKTSISASTIKPYTTGSTNVNLSLRRLMAKVTVHVDKSDMLSGSTTGSALASGALYIRQAAKAIYPFKEGGSRALSSSDVYSADNQTDYYTFTDAEKSDLTSSEVVFYVPENRQGTQSGISTQSGKVPTAASSIASLATYLEYTAVKVGTADGISGNISYRVYLGGNETNNFDVIGNTPYNAALDLSWDGMWEGTWRVSQGTGWNDGRTLRWLDADGNDISYVRLSKKKSTSVYAYFSPDGTTAATGRKDLSTHPYGWTLRGNGNLLAGSDGASGGYTIATGVIVKCLGTATVGGKQAMQVTISADATAAVTFNQTPAVSPHALAMRTTDNRTSSATLEVDIASTPFIGRWTDDVAPNYVAQRNLLTCYDPDSDTPDVPSSEGIWSIVGDTDAVAKVRLVNGAVAGTKYVEIIGNFASGAASIKITDTDDIRAVVIPLEGKISSMECTNLGTSFIDKAQPLTFTYKTNDNSSAMVVSEDASCTGLKLNRSLVEELIPPYMTSDNGVLGYEYKYEKTGVYTLLVHINTYDSNKVVPTGSSFSVDIATISITGYSTNTHRTTFLAYNPWKFITSDPVQGPLMNDYTLYRIPAREGATNCRVGWNTNPSDKPAETTSKTVSISNVVVYSPEHLKLDAKYANNAGYIGEKIATGTPGIVSPNFVVGTTYSLWVRLTNTSNFDYQTLGDYLYYDQGHYISSDWLTMSDAQKKEYLVNYFNGGSLGLSGYHPTEAEAWSYAPSGVTASNPTALQGIEFYTISKSIPSTWDLTYSMNGLTSDDVKTHSAGLFNVILKIVNPFNSSSPTMDKIVSQAYMRLHLYVWASVTGVTTTSPGYSSSGPGWVYQAYPYVFTDGKRIMGLDNFFTSKYVIRPQAETYTKASTTYFRGSGAELRLGGDYYGTAAESVWQFRNDNTFSTTSTDAQRRSELMSALSTNEGNSVFLFRTSNSETVNFPDYYGPGQANSITYSGLNSVLGSDYYHRESSTCLYYDPSGPAYTYTVAPTGQGTSKLFVIHIGETALVSNPYFFDPNNGFVNP